MHASARALLRPSASAASRRLLATSSKATPAKSAPLAVAHDAHHDVAAELTAAMSNGELAWCEVYGVDYATLLQEAHDESPLALNSPPARTAAAAAAAAPSATQGEQHDIWSVVFGTHK